MWPIRPFDGQVAFASETRAGLGSVKVPMPTRLSVRGRAVPARGRTANAVVSTAGRRESEGAIVALRPGNFGAAKGPDFRRAFEAGEDRWSAICRQSPNEIGGLPSKRCGTAKVGHLASVSSRDTSLQWPSTVQLAARPVGEPDGGNLQVRSLPHSGVRKSASNRLNQVCQPSQPASRTAGMKLSLTGTFWPFLRTRISFRPFLSIASMASRATQSER